MQKARVSWPAPGAQWIGAVGAEHARNLYLHFVRDFEATTTAGLTLHISAVSQYQVWVNGTYLGRGPAVGSQARYYFHTYPVPAPALREGANRLAVLFFHDGKATESVQGFQYGDPGLIAQLVGPNTDIVTDDTWRLRRAPEFSPSPNLYSRWSFYKELYHGENEDAWRLPEFDVSHWPAATTIAPPESPDFVRKLVPLDVPALKEAIVAPTRIVELANGLGLAAFASGEDAELPTAYTGQPLVFEKDEPLSAPSVTLDFGTMYVGYPEIEVEGENVIFEVWYAESLDLWRTDAVRLPKGGAWKAFQRRAYRFMKIVFLGHDGPVTLTRVRHHNAWYDYDERGVLEGPDEEVNRIIAVSKHTLKANTSYHYEDCPMREQALWVMDMRIMGLINAYLHGNLELTAKCLRQSFAIQREDGSVASTGPKDNAMFHHDFMMHLVATLKEHYQISADLNLVRELYPQIAGMHGYLSLWKGEDGLLDTDLKQRAGGAFLDWSHSIEKQGKLTLLNALWACCLEDMAELATLCGDDGPACAYRDEAAAVRAATHAALFDTSAGLYRDAWRHGELLPTISQQANMAAILAGVAPDALVPDIMAKVWDSDTYPRPFGPSYYLVVFDALAKIGRFDAMIDVIRSYWGEMLSRGATTWWEVFNPDTEKWVYPHPYLGNTPTYEMDFVPISACHGWSGTPAYAIPRYLLGVNLSQLHENRIVIDPGLPGYFERMTYAVPVRGGMLRLEYRGDGKSYAIEVLDQPEDILVVLPS